MKSPSHFARKPCKKWIFLGSLQWEKVGCGDNRELTPMTQVTEPTRKDVVIILLYGIGWMTIFKMTSI